MNERGKAPGCPFARRPLTVAVYSEHHDVAVWLLSHGADPNRESVMYYSACRSATAMLQLLIDAGGAINPPGSRGWPQLLTAGFKDRDDNVRLLLAQPSLDLTIIVDNKTLEQCARDSDKPALADMIGLEVPQAALLPIVGSRLSVGVVCPWLLGRG